MSNTILQGKVSFVNHERQYVMIEYEVNNKKKTINGQVDDKTQLQLKKDGIIKNTHQYHIGDIVNFTTALSGRGDKMIACNIQFLYNTSLDVILNKAKTQNNFIGYLKIIDDKVFVKEMDSYLFFTVTTSPWQIMPTEKELNEAVNFELQNIDNKEKVTAKLFNNNYIPQFYVAIKLYKNKTPIDATIYKITQYGIYVNVVEDKIQAKIPLSKIKNKTALKIGNTIKISISYLSPLKIVVEEK